MDEIDLGTKDVNENIQAESKEKYPDFWNNFDCVVKSASDKYPSVVRTRKTGRHGLGYESSGHVCYAHDSFYAMSIWVLNHEDYYEHLKCPICKQYKPFEN